MEIIFLCVVEKNNKGNVNPRDFMVVYIYIYCQCKTKGLADDNGFFKIYIKPGRLETIY